MSFLKKLYHRKFLCSFLLSATIGFAISAVCGFGFEYYTNDDYQISLLIAKGESHNLYVNFFLTSILSVIQQSLPFINCFSILQHICCFFSIVIIVYVLLNKMNSFIGLLTSALICSFVFISDVLIIQYSQTPVVMCVAGVLLASYANLFESNRKYKIFQTITSNIIIVIASLFRFTPFIVCAGFSMLFLLCIIYLKYTSIDKSKTFIAKLTDAVRNCISLILVIIISFSISFGLYFSSEMINSSNPSYSKYVEYNKARMRVADYQVAPYEGNEDFYNGVGIHSQVELSMITFDKDLYNAQVLNQIADYSEKVVQNGDSKPVYAIKKTIKRLIRSTKDIYSSILSIRDKMGLPIGNKPFLLLLFILAIALVVLIVYIKRRIIISKSTTNKPANKLLCGIIIFTWLLFFLITKVNDQNFLCIPLFAIVLVALFFSKTQNYLAYIFFTIAPIAIYLYQYNFRISYRVSFAFIFPSIIFMLFLIDLPRIKVSSLYSINTFSYSLFLISLIFPSIWSFYNFYPQCSLNFDMKLRNYIENCDSNIFIVNTPTNACLDEGYYNSLLVPNIPENEVMLAWSNSSDYFVNDLKKKQIDNILLDSINSSERIVIEANETNSLDKQKKNYEDFYNIHYFNGDHIITLELEKTFNYSIKSENPEANIQAVGIYKVIRNDFTS